MCGISWQKWIRRGPFSQAAQSIEFNRSQLLARNGDARATAVCVSDAHLSEITQFWHLMCSWRIGLYLCITESN